MSALVLVGTLFAASVVGSLHCVGMCGAFVALAVGGPDSASSSSAGGRWWRRAAALQAAYHGGRLATYALLGAAAGAAGGLVNLAGALAGLQPIAAALAGGAMVIFGLATLLRTSGVRIAHLTPRLPETWTRLVREGHRRAMGRPPVARALAIGLLTTLLPCGWLYAFAIAAAGTGSAAMGALAMAAFWAGTLPALVALGAGVRGVLGPVGRRLPVVTALLLVGVGLWTLGGRAGIDPVALVARAQAKAMKAPAPTAAPAATTMPACCAEEERTERSDAKHDAGE